ncbi:MAG TPA: TetR/AcrR family transcriptional regulator [Granulicella sp.]
MGIRERREREKAELRQRILDAAQHLITEEGFAAMTMRRLAEQIEYSPASIYLHFKSREEIARELCELGCGKLLSKMQKAVAGKDAAGRIHALGQAYVRFGLENPETYRLIFMEDEAYMAAAFGNQSEKSAANQAGDLLLGAVQEYLKSIRRRQKAQEVVQLLWATLHGIVSLHLSCTGFQGAPPEELAALATGLVVKGLAGG